ncbi:MAG: lantibiotic dehydratase [Saprospiraceae bacterium]
MTNDAVTILPMTLIRSGGLPLDAWTPLACGIPDWAALHMAEQHAAEQLLLALDTALYALPESSLRTAVYNARKDFFQRRKLPSINLEETIQANGDLTQLLDSLRFWYRTQDEKLAAEILFEQNLAANYRSLQDITKSHDETLLRALLFASHDLLAAQPAFAEKPAADFDKKDRRTAFSLLQYLTRAVFKTSPLGRFTTVQVRDLRHIDGATQSHPVNMPEIGEPLDSKSLNTPNVALLPAIYEVLLREPAFFQSLIVSLNPCITSLLHAESTWLYFDGEREAFQQMEPDLVADFMVKLLLGNQRKMPFPEILKHLENEVEATKPQLQNLVIQLIDIGLLEWQMPESGLSPGWCATLYNYLGYLPSSPVLTEAAYLLHWLRTAARTMPFQTILEAQQLQREAVQKAKEFFEKHGGEMPPIPPEQIFFEDISQDMAVNLPQGVVEHLAGQLAECWQQKESHPLSPFRARLYDFAETIIADGENIDFLEFSRAFLGSGSSETRDVPATLVAETPRRLKPPIQPRHHGKIGALLQIFRENGEYKAVVNAMYPGGGKLFARWLPLFPLEVSEAVKNWCNSEKVASASFPWQGWSNANFQPSFSDISVAVPDGRAVGSAGARTILLGDLAVRKDEHGFPQLIEKQSGQPVVFNDLGLEASETRPPVIQVLWHLGVPAVSSESLLPEGFVSELNNGIRHRRRLEFQSLVLARAAWELRPEIWGELFSEKKSQAERIGLGIAALKAFGIPRWFFGQFTGRREKPQFFDMESPISILLLEKNLRGGSGNLLLTEMLPTPEQWLGDRVGEFVVECSVGSRQWQLGALTATAH